jgi:hypothetical protein
MRKNLVSKRGIAIEQLPEDLIDDLIIFGAIDQSSREVDLEIVALEAFSDWINRKRREYETRVGVPKSWEAPTVRFNRKGELTHAR